MSESLSSSTHATALLQFADLDGEPISNRDVPAYRKCVDDAQVELERTFDGGANVREIVSMRSDFIDSVVVNLWNRSRLAKSKHALLAVGGYGRGELHPYSDIDLAIILDKTSTKVERQAVAHLSTFLWDIGFSPIPCLFQYYRFNFLESWCFDYWKFRYVDLWVDTICLDGHSCRFEMSHIDIKMLDSLLRYLRSEVYSDPLFT